MNFTVIDKDNWHRKEYFEHYISAVPCTYSMSIKLDITKIKNAGYKLYPTMLYCIAKAVNRHQEFRMSFDGDGQLGYFHKMIPCYTIFHKDTETFSNIWTEFSEDYNTSCLEYEKDIKEFGEIKGMMAKPNLPVNTFTVSMLPWTSFEGFNLNLQKGYDYLLPIFTMGKYCETDGRYSLPMAVQVHHAACDGFHVCRFINELQDLLNETPVEI